MIRIDGRPRHKVAALAQTRGQLPPFVRAAGRGMDDKAVRSQLIAGPGQHG